MAPALRISYLWGLVGPDPGQVSSAMLGELYELRPVLVARLQSGTAQVTLTQRELTVHVAPSGLTLADGTILDPGVPMVVPRAIFPLLWCPNADATQIQKTTQVTDMLRVERVPCVYVIGGPMPAQCQGLDFDAHWTCIAPMNVTMHACAAVGEAVYVLGGSLGGGEPLSTMRMIKAHQWLELAPMRLGRKQFSAAFLNNRLFAIGGRVAGGDSTSRVECFDLQANAWQEACCLPCFRAGHQSATIDGLIYVFGGTCSSVDSFDGIRWDRVASLQRKRLYFGLAVSGATVFLAGGGQEYNPSTALSSLQSFNVRTKCWADLAPMPTARRFLSLTCVEPFLYAIGGVNAGHQTLSCIERYDMRTDTWTACTSWPVPIAAHAALTVGEQ